MRHLPMRKADWWVAFDDGRPHWWTPFLKPGFRHCWAIRHDAGIWTVINPAMSHTEVATIDGCGTATLADFVTGATAVAYLEGCTDRPVRVPWVMTPWTCVEVVKGLLGMRDPWVVTPWQLFKYARAKHGRIIFLQAGSQLPAPAGP